MGVGRFFHYIGSLALLVAIGLLIVTDVAAPTVNNLSMFTVSDRDSSSSASIRFGTFGYCVQSENSQDDCSSPAIGYNPIPIIRTTFPTVSISDATSTATSKLTNAMVLHPVATGLAGIALLLSFSAGFGSSFLATLVSALAFGTAVAALIVDFVNFAAIKAAIANDDGQSSVYGDFGVASWTLLAGTALLLVSTVILFFTCCSERRERRGHYPKGY
ncbi:actin cortical patch SUR7/pH-response regulator pali [Pseudomassariella vexata]|uniref:Actin cortical patch SUR7/pH-response regulator pali n=1 Tax=Pseudomassariella vexata TaxID=1141098 RepID=A0A1Y2E9H7_9PEZI|nr:actin cortical patch SUR7/pH-response regulator pali [Pseudomassariella vexata]ORY68238.1 actin cortical patch SUR7/pH-response regulator pali [Pseudomassariella vexata]